MEFHSTQTAHSQKKPTAKHAFQPFCISTIPRFTTVP